MKLLQVEILYESQPCCLYHKNILINISFFKTDGCAPVEFGRCVKHDSQTLLCIAKLLIFEQIRHLNDISKEWEQNTLIFFALAGNGNGAIVGQT